MPANGYALSESWFEVLDWAVREAQAQGLRVILDLHEFTALGNDPAANKVKFLAFWRQLSAHCQSAPESVLFEVLNEPIRKLTPAAVERIPGRRRWPLFARRTPPAPSSSARRSGTRLITWPNWSCRRRIAISL